MSTAITVTDQRQTGHRPDLTQAWLRDSSTSYVPARTTSLAELMRLADASASLPYSYLRSRIRCTSLKRMTQKVLNSIGTAVSPKNAKEGSGLP